MSNTLPTDPSMRCRFGFSSFQVGGNEDDFTIQIGGRRGGGAYPNAPTSCVTAVAISRTMANSRRMGAKISSCSRT